MTDYRLCAKLMVCTYIRLKLGKEGTSTYCNFCRLLVHVVRSSRKGVGHGTNLAQSVKEDTQQAA